MPTRPFRTTPRVCSISAATDIMAAADTKDLKAKILRDVRVEASQMFDRNFERESFFGEAWRRRSSPVRGDGHVLISTGALRRSVMSRSDEDSITFYSTLPYAAIHNNGGVIKVTRKMKSFFWAMYYKAAGGFKRRKDGSLSRSKRQERLSAEAEFWKAMALKKVGEGVTIPRRRFLGLSPELESAVTGIIERNIEAYVNGIFGNLKKLEK